MSHIAEKLIHLSKFLIFDTETTGVPKDWNAPITESENWPRLVQIAWMLFDGSRNLIEKRNYIIRPEVFEIPQQASDIHKITTFIALNKGQSIKTILKEFGNALMQSKYVIGHNLDFDEKVVSAEFFRAKTAPYFDDKIKICTMKTSTDYCAIDGEYGYKWPKLSELYTKLFDEEILETHDAEKDMEATQKCFWELKDKGVIKLLKS